MINEPKHTFKILTLGESGVGKTCILRRFVENKFIKNHLATIGIDFRTKTIPINNYEVKLKIWDTAGEERFRNITNQYYKGADGIILVYDLNNKDTLTKIKDWMNQIHQNTSNDIGLVLVGNKSDLEGKRQITYSDARNYANKMNITYFEVSAKNDQNINEFFEGATKIFLSKYISEDEEERKIILRKNKGKAKNISKSKKDDKC